MGAEGSKHIRAVDFVKGVLIVLVFVGHIIPDETQDGFLRYAIYSFHMPLMIGISGFLFNIEKRKLKAAGLMKKYWQRLILPWSIAVVFYFVLWTKQAHGELHFRDLLHAFYHPGYHLWYVPVYLVFVFLSLLLWRILKNLKKRWIWMMLISLGISLAAKFNVIFFFAYNERLQKICTYIDYDLRLYFFFFFVLGLYCRSLYDRSLSGQRKAYLTETQAEATRTICMISFFTVAVLFYFEYPYLENVLFYIMNSALLMITIHDSIKGNLPQSRVLEYIGQYSLPIYLYHILCRELAQQVFELGSEGYYIMGTGLYILLCIVIYVFRNNAFACRFFYGRVPE